MSSTQNTGDRDTPDGIASSKERLQTLIRTLLPAGIVGRLGSTECPSDGEPADRPPETEGTDEDRVRWLVDAHGGRIKQSTVVSETGWSAAKVSRLLSDMEDAGEIHRYRISHEKVVCFPEYAS